MPTYTLMYFNAKGRAELIRLIFHASGTKFVDKRIEGKDWPALKPKIPHGTLPALDVDGTVYGESMAIARYAADQGGLRGKTPLEKLRADELIDNLQDFGKSYIRFKFEEKDEAKKAELQKEFVEKTIPNLLAKLNERLLKSGNKFFVGTSLTWADLAVFNTLETIDAFSPTAIDKFKELKEFKKRIEELPTLRPYLQARPKTDF